MEALKELNARHAAFVKKVHGTKFIVTGWRLTAVQSFYVVGTFVGCYATLKYFTPDQAELQKNLPRARHTGRPGERPPALAALEEALQESKRLKEANEAAKAAAR